MDILNQIIHAIEQGIEWLFSTDLPKDTADCLARIITYATQELIPLMWEWIEVLTGQG